MFNAFQQQMYEMNRTFAITTLETLLQKSSRTQSAINALFFLLNAALTKDSYVTNRLAHEFYPEEKYIKVVEFFNEINLLVNNKDTEHSFIKAITEKRFFSAADVEAHQQLLSIEFSKQFKKDIVKWLNDKFKLKIFKKKDMFIIYERHQNIFDEAEEQQRTSSGSSKNFKA